MATGPALGGPWTGTCPGTSRSTRSTLRLARRCASSGRGRTSPSVARGPPSPSSTTTARTASRRWSSAKPRGFTGMRATPKICSMPSTWRTRASSPWSRSPSWTTGSLSERRRRKRRTPTRRCRNRRPRGAPARGGPPAPRGRRRAPARWAAASSGRRRPAWCRSLRGTGGTSCRAGTRRRRTRVPRQWWSPCGAAGAGRGGLAGTSSRRTLRRSTGSGGRPPGARRRRAGGPSTPWKAAPSPASSPRPSTAPCARRRRVGGCTRRSTARSRRCSGCCSAPCRRSTTPRSPGARRTSR
mmetsp:Transcript_4576/g.12980  ORF Transcript_4576/g.12980 Transcript_4576/m.12980 type:complete len:298 (-) Transcript_4576:269-1162(-)